MVAIKPKTVVRMRLAGAAASHSRTDVTVRDLETTIDEPEVRGGTNKGLSPTETLMAALIGCTNVITHKIAAADGIEIAAMTVDADVGFDRRGVTLEADVDVPFPDIKLTINISTTASATEVDKIKEDLAKFCPLAKVLRQAGTTIDEDWVVTRP
jgi:putative redox protein